jgi:hypothetical protein
MLLCSVLFVMMYVICKCHFAYYDSAQFNEAQYHYYSYHSGDHHSATNFLLKLILQSVSVMLFNCHSSVRHSSKCHGATATTATINKISFLKVRLH